jgi:cyclophilin family peptidyl-prolyl cis-trans isomerase
VPDFVVQTGDRTDTGSSDAGFTFDAEENPVEQRAGRIAMGLDYKDDRPVCDSAGSQFYFMRSLQLHLDRAFSVSGEVESGFEVWRTRSRATLSCASAGSTKIEAAISRPASARQRVRSGGFR